MKFGFGKKITVNTTPQTIIFNENNTGWYANRVDIINVSANDVLVFPNIDSSVWGEVSGSCIIVPAGFAQTLVGDGRPPLFKITMATSSGSSDIVVNAF